MQEECLRSGADGFLSKPLDIEQLLSTIRNSAMARQLVAA